MAKTSVVQTSVTVTGDGETLQYILPVATNAAAPSGGAYPYPFLAGFNNVAIPTGATGVLIVPPTGNAVAITLKGIAGDTGTPLNPSQPFYLPFPTGATSFGVTVGGGITVGLQFT